MATINQLLSLETEVQTAVGTLNAAIRAAAKEGLEVELDIIDRRCLEGMFPHLGASVHVTPSKVDLVWKGVGSSEH